MKTIFQKIIDGEIPSHKVYEDDKFIAILDINPKALGHTLLIPKEVKEDILKEGEQTRSDIINLGSDLSKKLMSKLGATGVSLKFNVGETSGQEVFHTHLHIVPSYKEARDKNNFSEVIKKMDS